MVLSLEIIVALWILFLNGLIMEGARVVSMDDVEQLPSHDRTGERGAFKLANTRFHGRRIRRNALDDEKKADLESDEISDYDDNITGTRPSVNDDIMDENEVATSQTRPTEDANDHISTKKKSKKQKKKTTRIASHKKKKKSASTTSHKKKTTSDTGSNGCNCFNSNTTAGTDHPITQETVKPIPNRRYKRCPHGMYYRKGCKVCYCLPKRTFCESVYTSEDCAYWALKIHCDASRLAYEYNAKCEGTCACKLCKDPLKTITTCARLPCHNAVLEEYGVLKTNVTQWASETNPESGSAIGGKAPVNRPVAMGL